MKQIKVEKLIHYDYTINVEDILDDISIYKSIPIDQITDKNILNYIEELSIDELWDSCIEDNTEVINEEIMPIY